jgi:hypothetical protein
MNTTLAVVIPTESNGEELGIKTVSQAEMTAFDRQSYRGVRKPKIVPQELIDLAIRNNPLESIPRWQFTDEVKASSVFRQNFPTLKSGFLRQQFLQLADIGITFENSIVEIEEIIQSEQDDNHLRVHLSSLKNSFMAMREIFLFLDFILEKDKFEEKHLTAIHTICNAFNLIGDQKRRERFIAPIAKMCLFNRERYIMEMPTVLSVDNLPELLLAFPVCFLNGLSAKNKIGNDPEPSEAVRLICDAVGSTSFAWFYQMYNRRDRLITAYKGADPIPADYLEFRTQLSSLIDLDVIATPYHEIASTEWADPAWRSSIDPIAFGIQQEIPFITIFKRWSGNGIFPLIPDLMADTIDHIAKHVDRLNSFNTNTYWYKGTSGTCLGNGLKSFGNTVVAKFKEGKIIEFLRS